MSNLHAFLYSVELKIRYFEKRLNGTLSVPYNERECLFHTAIEESAYHTPRIVVMDELSLISEMIKTAVAHSSTGNISTCLQPSSIFLYHTLHLSLSQTLWFSLRSLRQIQLMEF